MVSVAKRHPGLALLVHPNMGALSSLQRSFEMHDLHSVVSRDMPTALLALSQHDFTVVVIHHRVAEEGDGWALGSLARRLFPQAHIAIICTEKDVAALQAAINNRLDQVFDETAGGEQIAEAILRKQAKDETHKVQYKAVSRFPFPEKSYTLAVFTSAMVGTIVSTASTRV